jgi:hypothetical protein
MGIRMPAGSWFPPDNPDPIRPGDHDWDDAFEKTRSCLLVVFLLGFAALFVLVVFGVI